jgi:hypothetical protein
VIAFNYNFKDVEFTDILFNINRTRKGEMFPRFLKEGNNIFFTDGNYLRIYDVSDINTPKEKHSINLGDYIWNVKFMEDTLYTGEDGADFNYLKRLTYDYQTKPEVIDSIKGLGATSHLHINSTHLIRNNMSSLRVWKRPLTERTYDWRHWLKDMEDSRIRGNHLFRLTGLGVIVYDISDFDNVTAIDTLPKFGKHIEIFKNLLVFGGGGVDQHLFIYDISDMDNIVQRACYKWGNSGFKLDRISNYVYCRLSSGAMDVLDLSKYVNEPDKSFKISSPNGGETLKVGTNATISWTSTGYMDRVTLEYNIDGGAWKAITTVVDNDGAWEWTVPDDISDKVKVRIRSIATGDNVSDVSNAVFEITDKVSVLPDADKWVVSLPGQSAQRLEVVDLKGRVVAHSALRLRSVTDGELSDSDCRLLLKGVERGVYFVRIDGKRVRKVVVF